MDGSYRKLGFMLSRGWLRYPHRYKPVIVAIALLLLLGSFTANLSFVARLYSANWDEAHHLYDGYRILTRHDYRANAEVPPLVKITAALPLLRLHPAVPADTGTPQTENAFLAGRSFVFANGGDRLLFPARIACMLFSLAMALLIFAAGRHLFGRLAGLCAIFLFVFDPNVLAHGTLISTDMGSACLLFAATYAFYRYSVRFAWGWLAATGLLAGLALVTKFTGILMAPILLLLAVAEGIRQRRLAVAARLAGAALTALLCGWLVLWAFYGFRFAPAAGGLQLSPVLTDYLASMPNPADGVRLAFIARHRLLPEAYIWGLANTKHIEAEYTSYFFGRVYRHGPRLYFPAAFLIKSTLPFLVLLVLAPAVWVKCRRTCGRALLFLLLPVVIYFSIVITSHFDIGARHLMPVYPFLYVLTGAAAAVLLRRSPYTAILAVVLLGWQLVTTVRVSPDYMAYGNEAWGGPANVRRYLSDANVDWGQQLKTVRQYLQQNHIDNCWFAYFPDGAVEPKDYGIHCHRLPTPSGLWWFQLPMQVPSVIDGTVLISESDLDGVESGDGALNPYDGFQKVQPVAVLQHGIFVYQGLFSVPLASAWVAVRESGKALDAGDVAHARTLAEQALALAPDSTRIQLQVAQVLARQQDLAEARKHYLMAQQIMEHVRPDLQREELGPQIQGGLEATRSK